MTILLDNIGKQYYKNWIFKSLTLNIDRTEILGIRGNNGSGKSTLLQIISSVLTPTEGSIQYLIDGEEKPIESIRHEISLMAPATELLPNLTVNEILTFHFQFQKLQKNSSIDDLLISSWLIDAKHLLFKELSSGMKQRLKLAIAFWSNNQFILLDEPTSNLDERGILWVAELIQTKRNNRGLIIASNEERDFQFCDRMIDIHNYK